MQRRHAGYEHAEPDATSVPEERTLQEIAEQDAAEHIASPATDSRPHSEVGITGAQRHEDAR